VIAAAHAGWRGALAGVLEATLEAMETLGARRASTVAALGPMIARNSYEVDTEFADRFIAASTDHASFFSASAHDGHFMFDLAGFIAMRLRLAGIGLFEDLARDTYAEPENFYSYRRSVHRNEPDYGRHVAAIALL
jgi:YfiH family protein